MSETVNSSQQRPQHHRLNQQQRNLPPETASGSSAGNLRPSTSNSSLSVQEEEGEPLSECGSSDDGSVDPSVETLSAHSGKEQGSGNGALEAARTNDAGDMMKYKVNYPKLLESYKFLENEHLTLLKDLMNNTPMVAPKHPIEEILDDFALRIASKRDLAEHEMTHKVSGEVMNQLIAQQWRKRYYSLMEAIDLLYKNYQLLHRLYEGNEDVTEMLKSQRINPGELEEVLGDRSYHQGILAETDMTVTISTIFLSDLVSQCRVYCNDLRRQVQVKERLVHVLKRAKEQRKKLKIYVNALRDELRYVMYKMRESKDKMALEMSQLEQRTREQTLAQQQQQQQHASSSSGITTPLKVDAHNLSAKDFMYMQERIVELERILKEEENKRKRLHNKLQELIGNIRVYCRIRPHPESFMRVSSDDKLIIPADGLPDRVTRGWGTLMKCFIFDRVFDGSANQQEVFEAVQDLIVSCVDGYNVCIMAYGQTGSGKTHTMMGTAQQPGVNRRSVHHLLEVTKGRRQWTYKLSVSILEIYQEEVYDLLSPSNAKSLNVVKMMATQDDELVLHNLVEQEVATEMDVLRFLEMGERSRKVASTLMNHSSSRSHFVMLLRVRGENNVHKTTSNGTLTLCDLAGSENVSKSGATGERFQEAASINRSLTALGRAFDLLRRKQKPCYRETKLTHLLKPTLGGDAKCLLIVNVRSEVQNVDESLRAIQFGQGAMQVSPEQVQSRNAVRSQAGDIVRNYSGTCSSTPATLPTSSSSQSLSRYTKK